jgi:hypothetical protein
LALHRRTSVEMIEKYYASHIKTNIDAAAINIRSGDGLSKPLRPSVNSAKAPP